MSYAWARNRIKQRIRVCRAPWKGTAYLWPQEDGGKIHTAIVVDFGSSSLYTEYAPTQEDKDATDWELAE